MSISQKQRDMSFMSRNLSGFKVVYLVTGLFIIRMLGLFMILPVFSVVATQYPDATPYRIGLAVGAYGLSQALFQIPSGYLSDRWGRKPIIAVGLVLFLLGSLICSLTNHLTGIIVGRCIQGIGAVGSVLLALVADSTPAEIRTRAMAVVGMGIGGSFLLAMILGPLLMAWIGLKGIFGSMVMLTFLGFLLCYQCPNTKVSAQPKLTWSVIRSVLLNQMQLELSFGIFALHAVLTSLFLCVPTYLKQLALLQQEQSVYYLVILLFSGVFMWLLIRAMESRNKSNQIRSFAILFLLGSEIILLFLTESLVGVSVGLLVFFIGFNILESNLPAMVSKVTPSEQKGLALGVYASMQFFGICLGGLLGGWVNQHFGHKGVLVQNSGILLLWLLWVYKNQQQISFNHLSRFTKVNASNI